MQQLPELGVVPVAGTAEGGERLEGSDRRLRTAEMAILNEIRALADRFGRRLERVEIELYNR